MASSFWSDNPCVPGWINRLGTWWNGNETKLLHEGKHTVSSSLPKGFVGERAKESDAVELSHFWKQHFLSSRVSQCLVPPEHIQACIRDRVWEVFVVRLVGKIIATGVRRWLINLHIQDKVFPKAGMVDYFCVHPDVQHQGIGRYILGMLHNTAPVPMPPHLILWEGLQVKVPPLVANTYWVKQRPKLFPIALSMAKQNIPCVLLQNTPKVWAECVRGKDIWSEGNLREVNVFRVPAGIVAIWNTFHRSIPDGEQIGIVLSGNAIAIDQVSLVGPFGVLLSAGCPDGSKGWSRDSLFQFVCYNLSTNVNSSQFPVLAV